MTDLRVTRLSVEALIQTDNPNLRITRESVEALIQTDNPNLRISRLSVEALILDSGLTAVGKDLDLRWDISAAIGDTCQLVWDVSDTTAVGDNIQLVWDVTGFVGDTIQLVWDVLVESENLIQGYGGWGMQL